MKSITFFNNKGGVGKTTLLCNIAAYLALHLNKKVCVIDADPQCNATQYFFDDKIVDKIYDSTARTTIYSIIEPLSIGEGYSKSIPVRKSEAFGIDVVLGDPRLALIEDFFAREWASSKSGDIRGIKSSLAFSEILSRLNGYDFVLIDVSPSLGAINRAILLSSDFFVSPMSIDIFSLRAFENITEWLKDWTDDWDSALSNVKAADRKNIPSLKHGKAKFLGYVTQQYLAKTDASGQRRAVGAYEKIQSRIDGVIAECFSDQDLAEPPFQIGTVPNLFSLIPMSQSSHKPVFQLTGKDGVVGAHFAKVQDSKDIFGKVAKQLASLAEND